MKANSMAAMREALERAIDAIQTMIALYDEEHTAAVQIGATWERSDTSEANAIIEQARAALAAPPRNCDVGTADEQTERYYAACHRYDHCTSCPVFARWGTFAVGKPKSCQMIWGQMPFAKAEGGADETNS